jgi:drug/metabolite transporter (DMT)-like permease
MLRRRALAYFALILAVFIWGVNFLVVKHGIEAWDKQKFSFLASRFWLACLVYALVLTAHYKSPRKAFTLKRQTILQAGLVGILLAAGYGFQTWYLQTGSPVNASFLTSTTVLFAPLIAFLFRQKVYSTTVAGALVALIGIVLIEWDPEKMGFDGQSFFALFAAIAFAVEILLVSRFAPPDKSLQWTTFSCLSVALIMTILALGIDEWTWSKEQAAGRVSAVVFTGVFATAVALGLQNWAQAQSIDGVKIIDGPRAAILATLEPVFTWLATGFLILLELQKEELMELRLKKAVGCLLILTGTLLSELAAAKRSQKTEGLQELPAPST